MEEFREKTLEEDSKTGDTEVAEKEQAEALKTETAETEALKKEEAEPDHKDQKSRKGIILSAALLLLVVAALVIIRFTWLAPKNIVKRAVEATFTAENFLRGTGYEEILGTMDILKKMDENGGRLNTELTLLSVNDRKICLGIGNAFAIDKVGKVLSGDLSILADEAVLVNAKYLADEEASYFTIENVLDGFLMVPNRGLVSKYNESSFSTTYGKLKGEDLDLTWFESDEQTEASFMQQTFLQDISVEWAHSEVISLGEQSRKCQKYIVSIPEQTLEELVIQNYRKQSEGAENLLSLTGQSVPLQGLESVIRSEIKEGITLDLYLDKKKVVSVRAKGSFAGTPYEVELDLAGSEIETSNIICSFSVRSVNGILTLDSGRTEDGIVTKLLLSGADLDNRIQLEYTQIFNGQTSSLVGEGQLLFNEREQADLKLEGVFNKIEKGRAFNLEIQDASLSVGEECLHFSADFGIGKDPGVIEKIGAAEKKLEVFSVTQDELDAFLEENSVGLQDLKDNLEHIYEKLSGQETVQEEAPVEDGSSGEAGTENGGTDEADGTGMDGDESSTTGQEPSTEKTKLEEGSFFRWKETEELYQQVLSGMKADLTVKMGSDWYRKDQWRIRILSVTKTEERDPDWNPDIDPKVVYKVEYSYENLGWKDPYLLWDGISPVFETAALDGDGNPGIEYELDYCYPKEAAVGEKAEGTVCFAFEKEGPFTIFLKQIDSEGEVLTAAFEVVPEE